MDFVITQILTEQNLIDVRLLLRTITDLLWLNLLNIGWLIH